MYASLPVTATAARGTHPTGMHSCLLMSANRLTVIASQLFICIYNLLALMAVYVFNCIWKMLINRIYYQHMVFVYKICKHGNTSLL